MAFRASELRLILGIQAYGTTNLSRLRRDIASLGSAANAANANQLRVQDQIVAKRTQVAQSAQRVANLESRLANQRSVIDAQTAVAAERFAQRRAALTQRELQAAETLANRRIQIGRLQDRIGAMGGSGMQKFNVQEAQLAQRRLGFQNQLNTLERAGIGLQAQSFRNRAAEIQQRQKLEAIAGSPQRMQRLLAMKKTFEAAAPFEQVATLRYKAILADAEKIAKAQAHMPGQVAAINQQLAVTQEQEKLIQSRRFEQAAALGRANEALVMQQGTLTTIEARIAAIAEEQKLITTQEGLTNAQRTKALDTLAAENAALEVEKVKLAEITAEEERLATIRMQEARAADARMAKAARAQSLETTGRTIAHVGRTAQFAGLIATAGFTAAGNAAAELSRSTALAGTQMRDVTGEMAQATIRGKELENQILRLMQRFPATAQEMADSAYEIFSSMNLIKNGQVDVAKGFQLMATANKIAVAGQVDLSEATSAMITVLNNFDPTLQHVNQTMNQVFSIVRFGRMRMNDFGAAMTPLAPVAKTFGLSLTDVGSALATLSILFKSPQQGAQGLARAIELLNLEPFKKGLKEYGVQVTDTTGRMRPLHKVIEDLVKAFPEVSTSQKGVVNLLVDISKASGLTKAGIQGTVQARRAIGALVTSMALYRNILANVTNNQGEFNKAYQTLNATPGVQWQIFVNQMRVFALVIGRAALPYLLQFADQLIAAAHWVENLIKKTDGAIVKWGVWISVGALLGGTFLNMAGSLLALIANFRIATLSMTAMSTEATKASAAAGLLAKSMSILMGIGIISIPIVLQLIRGGEPGLWTLLTSALAGAAGGAMIGGPVGAALGALTVPIVVEVIAHYQKPDKRTGQQIAYDAYKESLPFFGGFKWPWEKGKGGAMSFNEFKRTHPWLDPKNFKIPEIGEDIVRKGKPGVAKTKTLLDQYNDLMKSYSKEWLKAQEDMLNAITGGDKGKADEAARLAKERARIHAQAWKQMQEQIDQTVDKLGQTYDKFLQENKQAFGELFQGPALSGFMGDIYKGINDILMQFGQTIPVPIQLINRDLELQIANFEKLREGYAALLKKGVPLEVVQEIQRMGLAGLPFVQGLVQASGPEFQKFVNNIKTKQKDIEKYTKIDFDKQLAQWKSYGSDIASKIIDGLSAEAAQAELKMGFEKYVIDLFGKTLKEDMAKTIAENMQAAAETAAAGKGAEAAAEKAQRAQIAAARRARAKARKLAPTTTTDKAAAGAARKTTPQPTVNLPQIVGGFIPGKPGITINNHGDTVTIHADGVHPTRVKQAINKKSFENRNKKR